MLKRIILNELATARRAGRSLFARYLRSACAMESSRTIGDGEFDAALSDLETKRLITYESEPVSGDRLYSITDQGLEVIK